MAAPLPVRRFRTRRIYHPAMRDLVPMFVAIAVMFAVVRVARRRRDSRHAGARTVRLAVGDAGVTRELADGRVEHLAWERLVSVEVVCTPVKTADGASAFALLAQDDGTGCLVPLGTGLDVEALSGLAARRGIRVESILDAARHRPPHRRMVWAGDPA